MKLSTKQLQAAVRPLTISKSQTVLSALIRRHRMKMGNETTNTLIYITKEFTKI